MGRALPQRRIWAHCITLPLSFSLLWVHTSLFLTMADEELEAIGVNECRNYRQSKGETDMRNTILAQVLDQSARARLNNLALVKPDKANAVENYLIQMARFGKLGGKISESGLIEILEKVCQQTEKKMTVTFNRRRVMDSDDEDDD
ncbi:hypothetical protein F7725_026241 [Dissostichus mawsoni]|uniref:Programmed cell death 5 n=1 Tax=Dissostichus mawsoni TaxID=36200 RepID=A0A7J5X6G7_DISMA|nr:hypothetical protein F7725_026241 [Dissostichus mawsoni]